MNRAGDPPSNQREEDAALVARAKRGDRDAFRALVERHERKAYAVALGMVKQPDDARDIVQEAFLKVWKSLGAFEGQSAFYTWLYRIVTNLGIDHLRKGRAQVEYDDARVHDEDEVPGDEHILPRTLGFHPGRALESKQMGAAIQRALDSLSETHRTVLILREVEGMSYRDMAQAMGCSEGTIMSRLFHARKKMQALLIDYV